MGVTTGQATQLDELIELFAHADDLDLQRGALAKENSNKTLFAMSSVDV